MMAWDARATCSSEAEGQGRAKPPPPNILTRKHHAPSFIRSLMSGPKSRSKRSENERITKIALSLSFIPTDDKSQL